MSAGQTSGTGAMTELEDEKVRKDGILSNRDKAQRLPGQSLDGKGVEIDEYKDNPSNRRPSSGDGPQPDMQVIAEGSTEPPPKTDKPEPTEPCEQVDRPGFDLGGSTGKTHAGKGLGLGTDAKENGRKGWGLPR
ncbi:hypothetical protein CCR94_02640 [Rhodoblastus sphagnicola]|uniref:Uncharacterized protein n=2 Tax=Rhodoblastus sphagnicola TaxID=333368 RepID=A0A2S6NF04_9HYPH|nr:hypothetical protein CCR94_02640 [Rhodoblastus sphagnicola]